MFIIVLTIFVHAGLYAFGQTTSATLIPVRFIDSTTAFGLCFAVILSGATDRPLEESSTTIAGKDSIMFPGGVITTHFTRNVVQDAT